MIRDGRIGKGEFILVGKGVGNLNHDASGVTTFPVLTCDLQCQRSLRHFFHRPSKAYTTGTRKRRKVHTDIEGGETRWHKTGKTRPIFVGGKVKGYKKILVLYTNYGKQRKPEKTNWVMHQYHLGNNEEEKDGELVVSKVFYQTQPRQCGSFIKESLSSKSNGQNGHEDGNLRTNAFFEYYNSSLIAFEQGNQNRASTPQLLSHFAVHNGSFIS